jgi:hypothetical protein
MGTGVSEELITGEAVFYQQRTDKLISRYSKYVSRDGDYVEKQSEIKWEPSLQLNIKELQNFLHSYFQTHFGQCVVLAPQMGSVARLVRKTLRQA